MGVLYLEFIPDHHVEGEELFIEILRADISEDLFRFFDLLLQSPCFWELYGVNNFIDFPEVESVQAQVD